MVRNAVYNHAINGHSKEWTYTPQEYLLFLASSLSERMLSFGNSDSHTCFRRCNGYHLNVEVMVERDNSWESASLLFTTK